MRLFKFINESNFNEYYEKIKKECSLYLKNNKGNILYSGRDFNDIIVKSKVRKDRRPLSTSRKTHNNLDKIFNDIFGVRLRSESVFCTLNYRVANSYGRPYVIFPIGEYTFYWSTVLNDLYTKIKDFYTITNLLVDDDYSLFILYYISNKEDYIKNKSDEKIIDILKTNHGYEEEDAINLLKELKKKIDTDYNFVKKEIKSLYVSDKMLDETLDDEEIMLVCDEYYAIDADNEELIKRLNK